MSDATVVIDTPEGMQHWVFMSRLYGLALEINTDGAIRSVPGGIPALSALYLEGTIPKMRNTQKNRATVLRIMVGHTVGIIPDWRIQPTVLDALLTDEQKAAAR